MNNLKMLMIIKYLKNNKRRQDGFTILVAVVTASILLIIAMSIGGIALKEQLLSSSGKESQVAFYAADTAMECALYWDQNKGVFAPNQKGNPPTTAPTINCNNTSIQTTQSSINNNEYTHTFKLTGIPTSSGTTCGLVVIKKIMNDNSIGKDPTRVYTEVDAYGYNTCGASLNRLERGISAYY